MTQEIEVFAEQHEQDGTPIRRLSIVGYSLGGLVARYVIGLLFSRGWFNKVTPVNFTTFATPHLGVRTPFMGVHYSIWNILGARTLSVSGRQLFLVDSFRNTGRPLLSVLADPMSIFVVALSMFRRRTLYANIINDRSAPYYTTSISRSDPFAHLDVLDINYLPKYDPIILNPDNPATRKASGPRVSYPGRLLGSGQAFLKQAPLSILLGILIPLGSFFYLINAGVQSLRSQSRIRLHEQDQEGLKAGGYRVALMIQNARGLAENATENFGQSSSGFPMLREEHPGEQDNKPASAPYKGLSRFDLDQLDIAPTLHLTDGQFAMIDTLDNVGFRKYRVHIHKVRHTHAAIIVRISGRSSFDEGKLVIKHWLDEEFEI